MLKGQWPSRNRFPRRHDSSDHYLPDGWFEEKVKTKCIRNPAHRWAGETSGLAGSFLGPSTNYEWRMRSHTNIPPWNYSVMLWQTIKGPSGGMVALIICPLCCQMGATAVNNEIDSRADKDVGSRPEVASFRGRTNHCSPLIRKQLWWGARRIQGNWVGQKWGAMHNTISFARQLAATFEWRLSAGEKAHWGQKTTMMGLK